MGVPEALRDALADRYAFERELGHGGMAVVYLVNDLRHDRPVALKVLLPELAATLGPERFQREIKLAARLQHPHILTVHDSGEAAGQLWFTMPYVEGESLRDRLRRERQLPVEDALRIATEAARALDYAHHHGIVHRDIKPENILLTTDGSTLVADFGIALALGGDKGLTQTGLAIGTPAYMSPEQAAGDKTLDARTDLYSLASVLYEMLAGEPPYTGPTPQAIVIKRLTEPAPSVRAARPTVPPAVDEAIRKALALVPADRFTGMAQFVQALLGSMPSMTTAATTAASAATTPTVAPAAEQPKTPAIPATGRRRVPVTAIALILGLLIGGGALFAWRHRGDGAQPEGGTRIVAVLPFDNLGDSADAYFADGVADEVRTKLGKVAGLEVIARGSSLEYRHTTKRPAEIARELGADYLLTGTVRWEKSGGTSRVRVSPELVDARPGQPSRSKWGEQFDASLTDVFQVQADIATRVSDALGVALAASQRQTLVEKPTTNVAAYDAYLKGNEAAGGFITATPANLRQAIGYYERAVALDSGFAVAWAQLSRAHSSASPLRAADALQSLAAAKRALALDPSLPHAHLALGDYYNNIEQDWPRALEEYTVGRRGAPNDADLLTGIALVQRGQGHFQESMASLRQALLLDPRSASTARRLANVLLWLRRYPEAMEAAERALALSPQSIDLNETKAMILLAQGDLAGGRAVLRSAAARGDPTEVVAYVGLYWDLAWVLDEAQRQLLLRLTPDAFDGYRAGWARVLTQTYALRGDAAKTRVYADSARIADEELLKESPQDAERHVLHGVALAYLGRKADAVREGQRAVALMPLAKDAYSAPYVQHQLVRIYLQLGEPEKALDQLEPLLKIPYYLSPGWLRIDPTFDPLRKNPRFMKLVGGTA